MRNIAIVEDEDIAAAALEASIRRYERENGLELNVVRFSTADDFLKDYRSVYAVVFMDIQMPGTDGMEAAMRLRSMDRSVSIMFITALTQYAQRGYEVDAVGYLLKPVSYYDFSMKFRKALDTYMLTEDHNVVVEVAGGVCRLSCRRLMYVEILNHRLYYHMVDGVVETTGVLSKVEKQLESYGFLRCHNAYLVNPRFVVSVKGLTVQVGNEVLPISRPRKSSFMENLTRCLTSGEMGGIR